LAANFYGRTFSSIGGRLNFWRDTAQDAAAPTSGSI